VGIPSRVPHGVPGRASAPPTTPVLSAAAVVDITSTSATPRVTLTGGVPADGDLYAVIYPAALGSSITPGQVVLGVDPTGSAATWASDSPGVSLTTGVLTYASPAGPLTPGLSYRVAFAWTDAGSSYSNVAVSAPFTTRAVGAATLSTGYAIRSASVSTLAAGYVVRSAGNAALATGYSVRAAASSSLSIGYAVRSASLTTLAAGYSVRSGSSATLAVSYEIDAAAGAGSALLRVGYAVRASGAASLATSYAITTAGHATLAAGFVIRAAGSGTLPTGYVVRSAASASLQIGYAVLTDGTLPSWAETLYLYTPLTRAVARSCPITTAVTFSTPLR
jgi:hypothetical protein